MQAVWSHSILTRSGTRLIALGCILLFLVSSCATRENAVQTTAATAPTGMVGTWKATGPVEGSKGWGPPSKIVFQSDGKCVLDWGTQGRYKMQDEGRFEITVYEHASTVVTHGKYLRESDTVEVFENRYARVREGQ